MEEQSPRSNAALHFHIGLLAFGLPVLLPVVWLLGIRSAGRGGREGRWGWRTVALAAADTLLLGALTWAAITGALAKVEVGAEEDRPAIGIVASSDHEGPGAEIEAVVPGSPADDAGLVAGDVVLEARGRPIRDAGELSTVVSSSPLGRPLPLHVRRDHQEVEIVVVPRSVAEIDRAIRSAGDDCEVEDGPVPLTGIGFASVILLLLFLHARAGRARYGGAWLAILPVMIVAAAAAEVTADGVCLAEGEVRRGALLLGMLAQQLVMLGGGLALVTVLGRSGMLRLSVPPRLTDSRALAFGCLYAFAGMMRAAVLVLVLISLIPGAQDTSGGIIERFPPEQSSWMALFAVQALIVAPVAEELIFRGVLLPGLAHQLRPVPAVLFTALVFGAMHVPSHGVGAIAPAFLGVVLGWQRLRSGGLAAPILLHAINNGFALVAAASS